ncbi:hypothetical protein Tco_1517923 [Tanacetum coccineum]
MGECGRGCDDVEVGGRGGKWGDEGKDCGFGLGVGEVGGGVGKMWGDGGKKIEKDCGWKVNWEVVKRKRKDLRGWWRVGVEWKSTNDGVAASFELKLDSLPHAYTQTTKT